MIWESLLSNKHGPLFADTCENLMEGHHGGPPRKLLTLLLYETFSVTRSTLPLWYSLVSETAVGPFL